MGGQFSPHRSCSDRSAIHQRSVDLRVVAGLLKKAEEVMEILEAYDLTGSLRAAAKLAGCDHKTVAHWVGQRERAAGTVPVPERVRPVMGGLFAAKIDELVERSGGRIRADVAHDTLVAIGYEGP
jgi:molybdenum-dependent DNA-binding transcriptional regulator ModE